MNERARQGNQLQAISSMQRSFRLAPVAQAIALTIAAAGSAHAAQPFSAAWYAAKGALQETARTTGMVNGKPVSTLTNPAVQQQQANAQLQQSIANLGLAARGIALQQASQAMQHANLLKNAPSVPDGLGAGGLDTGSLVASWINANGPVQTTDANGKIVVGINQTADKAIANWESFNVGKNTIVQFNQASSDWAILNRIVDPLAAPSQIQGQIRAPGTVLIVNRNGIVFSGTSQINTRNLVAAAADITDSQFTTGGIYGANQAASFTNANGNLIVEQGAQITTSTPTSATQGGGYVLLMGKQVSNSGDIETPKGQIEMAAGDSFIIRKGVGTDANKASTTRGNEISPQFVTGSTAGQVVNTETGLLLAREGDITLAGHDVQQNGVAVATTNVNTRGTIHLLNSASDATGSVTLGGKAITTIALDDDGATALDSQRDALIKLSASEDLDRAGSSRGVFDNLSKQTDREDQSRIEIVSGGNVQFANGSLTLATGGQIAVSATNRAFAATGSILDVSGAVGVNLAMASNNVVVNVQGNELRDSPDNRDNGTLFNSNVTVDRRDLIEVKASAADPTDRWYTANGLLEVSGYVNNQTHGIGEWAAQGGTIQLGGKEVVTQTGSQFNLSGGTLNVATGYVAQTWLVGSDGNLYNADNAPANMTFKGVYKGFEVSHIRWGDDASEFFYNPLIAPQQRLENGYTVGRDAGQLIVDAPTAVLEGHIVANVYNGPMQIRARDAVDGYSQAQTAAAQSGALLFGQYGPGGLVGFDDTAIQIGDIADITAGMTVDTVLSSDRANTLWLDAGKLNDAGLSGLNFATGSGIAINAPLQLAAGGQLNMISAAVDIAADITAPSGSVTANNVFKNTRITDADNAAGIMIEKDVTIDLRGQWTNALLDPTDLTGMAHVNGGSVTMNSSGSITLSKGSVIDVSSGAAIQANGKLTGGRGGDVSLIAGDATGGTVLSGATLNLDGTLRAAGVNGGGKLVLSSPTTVLLGADASIDTGVLAAGTPAPVDVALGQSWTIPAGQVIPISGSVIYTTLALDTPAPVDVPFGVSPTAPLAAAWKLPNNVYIWTPGNARRYNPGETVPAGTIIGSWGLPTLPAGTILPSAVFPAGVPILPYAINYIKGQVASIPVTFAPGTRIVAGSVLPDTVMIQPPQGISDTLLRSGFASYDINSSSGILVPAGLVFTPVMPVLQLSTGGQSVATGNDPSAALDTWLPPLFTENPATGTLTQRGGASLTLRSVSKNTFGLLSGGGPLNILQGAGITVDPGQSINLQAFGQITVEGNLTAHGGSISVASIADGSTDASRNFDAAGNARGVSLWIGDHAVLDVSGQADQARDARGRAYGRADDGGSIALDGSTAFVVVRPGAQLNADGAAVNVDLPTGGNITLAGNGGTMEFSSYSGIYLDGQLHANGAGPGAAGGSLSMSLFTPGYTFTQNQVAPALRLIPSVLTLTQSHDNLLPDDIAPGTDAESMAFSRAVISADQVKAGGFDSLSLMSTDYLQFAGDVRLNLGQSLKLTASAFTSGLPVSNAALPGTPAPSGSVDLSAPYMLLQSIVTTIPDGVPTTGIRNPLASNAPTSASFAAHADLLDVQGPVVFSAMASQYDATAHAVVGTAAPGFADIALVSQGDLRFLPASATNPSTSTTLKTPWDLTLQAAQLYPTTGAKVLVMAGERNTSYAAKLNLLRSTDAIPDAPASVLGSIAFIAPDIEQGGIVRAPFGSITFGSDNPFTDVQTQQVKLLPGSVTSVSAAGLTVPYGSTVDGVTYSYNGTPIKPVAFPIDINGIVSGISVMGQTVDVQSGAVLDLSGGGTLTGAGFITGRGGSVNILTTPLINANPATLQSSAGDKVYAIVPGYASGYAPVAPEKGFGDPAIGQQVTIPAGVPGLAAGTYTLLPSTYALLPGAYRVELGKAVTTATTNPIAIGNGTWATTGTLGIANTHIGSAQASTVLITPGTAVRHYSQFDEEGYSDFFKASSAQFGTARPVLPSDGSTLMFGVAPATGSGTSTGPADKAFSFDGTALFQPAPGGFGGQVVISKAWGLGVSDGGNLEIYADAPTAGFNGISIAARDLNAIAAPRLLIGGRETLAQNPNAVITFAGGGNLTIDDGVTLKAGELFLAGDNVTVGKNVTLTTIGQGGASFDSTNGYSYSAGGITVLALSNGDLDFRGSANGRGALNIGAGAALYSEGTLTFATNGSVNLDASAHFGSRNISLAAGNLNIGSDADMAAGNAPAGLALDQALFNTLLHGDPLHGAPALEQLTLSTGSLNLYGTTTLDARGSGVDLVLATPAIYGVGGSGDVATLAADRIEWDSVVGLNPAAIAAAGPGTGSGTLTLAANEIALGQFAHLDATTTSRVTYGFASVNLNANDDITAAGNTALYVYQAPGTTPGDVFGKSGTGGNLTMSTSVLTGVQKSVASYTAGGMLSVVAPDGVAPTSDNTTVAGAEIDLNGNSVNLGSTILLPSGKLAVKAVNDIAMLDGSRIDLAGQPTVIQRTTVYGFGGTASFDSAQGNITQSAGSVIDVSATQANAGAITMTAVNGHVALSGAVKGAVDTGFVSGDFNATAAIIDDFDGLNARLTQGGVFDARSFDIKSGDLTIGDGVKARNVTVSVDNGSLTVTGKIDASGAAPGTIRLSAQNDLTLAGSAVLDAHGDALQVDSYGQSIAAKNRGHVELNTAAGTLHVQSGATMDLSTPDGVAYGDVQLNAPRTGETTGDIAIDTAGPFNVRGAYSVALNAMWTYDLPGGSVIDQALLDGYDLQSQNFIAAAYNNNVAAATLTANLQNKLGGLLALGKIFHLRPGVQITSSGDLSTSGDIDLSHYRYGPGADRDLTSATYGAGEPMALAVRAAGDLTIKGAISDGFGPGLKGSPDVYGAVIDVTTTSNFTFFSAADGGFLGDGIATYYDGNGENLYFTNDWTIPNDFFYNEVFNSFGIVDTKGNSYAPGSVIPKGAAINSALFPLEADASLPTVITLTLTPGVPDAPPTSALSVMLPGGSMSASLRLVAGADLHAADPRGLQTAQALQNKGNLTLNDPNYSSSLSATYLSVLRTGTGNLDLLAGGNFSETTPFGVYTAGTQSAPVLAADGSNPYDLIGKNTHAWYPEQGGDVLISAQGDVSGNIQLYNNGVGRYSDSNLISNWLWLQGGAGMTADPGAWSINFGSLGNTNPDPSNPVQAFAGFQGIGTLGGGNLTVIAGRNAGTIGTGDSTGLDLAVASSGRVLADGSLLQTGGGDLVVKVGGVLNPFPPSLASNQTPDYFGVVTDLRGNIMMNAGAIGGLAAGTDRRAWTPVDPRTLDADTNRHSLQTPGPAIAPGDGTVTITARGDLVIGGASDAGMVATILPNGLPFTPVGSTVPNSAGGLTNFSLWTPGTAIHLFSAGGDVAPLMGGDTSNINQNANGYYPGTLTVAAANGDIRFTDPRSANVGTPTLELIPSPEGQLALLAAGSIYGAGRTVMMSGADMSSLATPLRPLFAAAGQNRVSNATPDAASMVRQYSPIAFGEDTPVSDLHAGDRQPALIYAGVDIEDLIIGSAQEQRPNFGSGFMPEHTIWYGAAKPFQMIAGRDIVGMGATPSVFVNNSDSDITLVQAGRDIIYQSLTIGGPGLLQVQAGRNLYQGFYGAMESIGPMYNINSANLAGGAGITALAGVGAKGPDYADFAKLYFDVANQLPTGTALAGSGKVVQTYDQQLLAWLQQRFGYTGSAQDALATFLALPSEQQGVFVRQVYYAELTAGGREFNDHGSSRFGSYLRGRDAIAALFPTQDAQGKPIAYDGSVTMFSGTAIDPFSNTHTFENAGIHTDFGGAIQILNPGGQTVIGVEGVAPGPSAGLITQGEGDIDVYSAGSILLGQSRMMTTFGGNILAWSANGDINAGRGSKTTVVFTPPRLVYDDMGDVTLAPQVPSTGAGIATLNPIPEVAAGDVDLIAPLGTIDAGEAGIRVSGNVNLAALQVVNAANIQVQGKSTGLPLIATVNVSALTNASAAATQAAMAAQDVVSKERTAARQSLPSIFTVRVLGFGNDAAAGETAAPAGGSSNQQSSAGTAYNPASPLQFVSINGNADAAQVARLNDNERRHLPAQNR